MPINMKEYKYMINYDLLADVRIYFSLNTVSTNPLVKKTDVLSCGTSQLSPLKVQIPIQPLFF
jgi:hypothetical protein